MARLTINGIEVEVAEGATLLDAAERVGAKIPTLCYLKDIGPLTSCMLCVVKETVSGRMLPACATKAVDGMQIDTDGAEVRAARREILKMLLSEHVGDCEGPCSRICPAGLDIPRMLRYIASGDAAAAARIAKRNLIFPATLGRLCNAPCEKGCRRGMYDTPLAIRRLHGDAAETAIENQTANPKPLPATGKRIAIVGAGLAGLSAAWVCLMNGHACHVYERRATVCSSLRSLQEDQLPGHVLDAEIDSIIQLGPTFTFNYEVDGDIALDLLRAEFDAVIVACNLVASPQDGIFAAKDEPMLVRAVANGKAAAQQADAFVRGLPSQTLPVRFNTQIGRLRPEEKPAYAVERLTQADTNAVSPAAEAARCLHCDCLRPDSCKLRQYAEEYGLDSRLDRYMVRPAVDPIQSSGGVLFEPGKCIKCGICVEITQSARKDLGLTFVGRSLDSRVQVPFRETLDRGLRDTAHQCVRACPTGALAFRNQEEKT